MQTSHLLLIAAVIAAVSLVVTGQANFSFYKLSLQWAPAACNQQYFSCRPEVPCRFTIHGLWPQYANDTPVPPYNISTNKCSVKPTNPNDIPVILQSIQDNVTRLWPNLKNYTNLDRNKQFWQHEWKRHGMCSDYFNSTLDYFKATLSLATKYITLLQDMSITPSPTHLYTAKNMSEAIREKVGGYPEIACNKESGNGTLQLHEIRLCFDRKKPPTVIRNCTKRYSNCCSNDTNQIKFPPPPATG